LKNYYKILDSSIGFHEILIECRHVLFFEGSVCTAPYCKFKFVAYFVVPSKKPETFFLDVERVSEMHIQGNS